uniref:Putative Flagellar protein FliS n=1 Tax=mine drainage metagenome TaxID=410659 RepID=E6QK21_9ZZZZ
MSTYQQHTLEGASPVDLVVALYDGIVRFLYAAIAGVESGDAHARRAAVKRALDILIHLQARLRMDIGGRPAEVLSEFYASAFALILQASQAASAERFEEVIGYVRNVRDAWRQVSVETSRASSVGQVSMAGPAGAAQTGNAPQATRWTA